MVVTFLSIDLIGVLVAAVASQVLGVLWYHESFLGSAWAKEIGMKSSEMKNMSDKAPYIRSFASSLVMAFILAYMMFFLNATMLMEAVTTATWLWLGFIATTLMINYSFQDRTLKLYLIDSSYQLASLIVMGITIVLI